MTLSIRTRFSVLLIVISAGIVHKVYSSEGGAVYSTNCLICHGEYAHGAMPGVPDLYINRAWLMQSDTKLLKRINEGIQSSDSAIAMPPKGGNTNLTNEDIKASIQHMRKLLKADH